MSSQKSKSILEKSFKKNKSLPKVKMLKAYTKKYFRKKIKFLKKTFKKKISEGLFSVCLVKNMHSNVMHVFDYAKGQERPLKICITMLKEYALECEHSKAYSKKHCNAYF